MSRGARWVRHCARSADPCTPTAHSQLVSRLAQNARSKRQNPSPLYIESTLSRSVTIACVKALRQLHNPLGAGGIGSSGEAASFVTSLSITSCSRESCCSSVGGRLVVDSSSATGGSRASSPPPVPRVWLLPDGRSPPCSPCNRYPLARTHELDSNGPQARSVLSGGLLCL